MFSSLINQLSLTSSKTQPAPMEKFGKKFRAKYFTNLDPDVYPVNHGSYGLTPTPVHEKYLEFITKHASYPDKYLKEEQKQNYIHSLEALSKVLNCDYHNLAIVDNATTGINTVLRSFPLQKGDSIVIQSTVYGACGKTVRFLKDQYDVEFHVVELNYPIADKEVLSMFEKVFKEAKPKMCMFDTISSMPGVVFPHAQMIQLCKKYKILSLIDGAHGIGCIPQDLSALKPDFYVSNLHKWFFVPFGCAVLYVDPKYHKYIHTLPISHSYLPSTVDLSNEDEKNRLIDRFYFNGTKNFASIDVIPYAIEFRQQVCRGEKAIYDYCHNLAVQVGQLVGKKWNTTALDQKHATQISTMVTIPVPVDVPDFIENWSKYDNKIYAKCFAKKAYTPCIAHNGKLLARYSCQVYNELSDYDYASDVLIEALNEVAKEEELIK
ncbi:hypothetical protein KGF57_000545 [Candida theae]|uniref:Aminotransferase class V domain-containing protein n=1 Tax=Candida theae TaxID=1198502 RepID=A0AAD5BJD6_9ASCO|nr:uncharacterized protein KGF57_000545 [Candida theae]KAI5967116.1 hypothetical protein KGF57_000545 [Candida theae]